MFSNLSNNLIGIINKLKGRGHLSEEDIDKAMREVRIALLEADVALPVVKEFIEKVKYKAKGTEVLKSIMPGQMVVKIVHDELINILGGNSELLANNELDRLENDSTKFELNLSVPSPAVIMLVGLQGSGKTTTAAKLALRLKQKKKKKVLLVSTDIYRPAAQLQLESIAKQISIESLTIIPEQNPIEICHRGLEEAKLKQYDVIIIDTAGRLHTDQELMKELLDIKSLTKPTEILLVSDAMIGQEAVTIAKEFNQHLDITGVILTRVDGDARGGAALSMSVATGCLIKFIGVGEKPNEIEQFQPERAASRILGMGDIISLVERAAETINIEEAEKIANKLKKGHFDMNDLLQQMQSLRKMGSISSVLAMIPGISKFKDMLDTDMLNDKVISHQEAIIKSMTLKERKNPSIMNGSRRQRIAKGSGTKIEDVNKLIKQFNNMGDMIKKLNKPGKREKTSLLNRLLKDFPVK